MFLKVVFLISLLQFGKTQILNQCVREIRGLKVDLQEEVRTAIDDKATKEDVRQRAVEVVNSLNNSVTAGNQQIMNTLQEMVESQEENKTSGEQCVSRDELRAVQREMQRERRREIQSLTRIVTEIKNNTALKSIAEQCVMREEVQTLIHNEVQLLKNEIQSHIETVAEAVQSLQTVQTEMQLLMRHVAEVTNNTNQLLSTESPTRDELQAVQMEIQSLTRLVTETKSNTANLLAGSTNPRYTCNGTPGWRKVAFINMTDTSHNCPPGLNLTSYSKRTCGRAHTNWGDCSSTTFSVGGTEYSRVCGRIRGYQVGSTLAFRYFQTIERQYVDGVSLTHRHGHTGEKKHIWTFASGIEYSRSSDTPTNKCPCDTSDSRVYAPPFIDNNYFCESGSHIPSFRLPYIDGRFFPDDPLWDGQGCPSTNTCCQLNNPPWFTKNLPTATTDNIELRLCLNNPYPLADIAIELIELYTQ